jgi:hypothetical protein
VLSDKGTACPVGWAFLILEISERGHCFSISRLAKYVLPVFILPKKKGDIFL